MKTHRDIPKAPRKLSRTSRQHILLEPRNLFISPTIFFKAATQNQQEHEQSNEQNNANNQP